jgi:hypothetical protein
MVSTQELPFQEDKGNVDCITLAESTLRRIKPREPEDFDYSAQLRLASQHRRAAAMILTTRLAPQLRLLRQIGNPNRPTTIPTTCLDKKTSREWISHRQQLVRIDSNESASSTNRRSSIDDSCGFVDNHPRIKLSHLYLFAQRAFPSPGHVMPVPDYLHGPPCNMGSRVTPYKCAPRAFFFFCAVPNCCSFLLAVATIPR